MSEKTNWDRINEQDVTDSVRYRDVYEDQQLDRTKIQKKQKPTSRIIFSVVVAILSALLIYSMWSGIEYFATTISQNGMSAFIVTNDTKRDDLYYRVITDGDEKTYQAIDKNGKAYGKEYKDAKSVPIPDWYKEKQEKSSMLYYFQPSFLKLIVSLAVGLLVFVILYQLMMRNLDAQNMMSDTSDINQYQNDQHIALPEEIQRKFDWFPDVGAHSNVQVSSMISHMALTNKGLNKILVAKRAKSDILDEDGDVLYYKGEILYDDDGNPIMESKPVIDEKFMDDLFTASGAPDDKSIRKYYDSTAIPYNPGNKDRDKLKGYNTVADLINNDWILPEYEPQRPAGAYLVDTAPVNTMVLAITRAGKGQTVIEPTIDMWLRERKPNNMVINDPKGELLVKNYVKATVRGFQVVQFNLINAMKTDIYNRAPRFVMKSYNIM